MGYSPGIGAYHLIAMSTISQQQRISVIASALTTDAREAPRLAREAGFNGLLLDAYAPALNLTELSQSGRRELRHLIASQAQTLVGVQVDVGTKGFGPGADIDRLLARLSRAIEAAVDLGAGVTCLDLGPLPQPLETQKPKTAVTPEQAGLIILPKPSDASTTAPVATEPAATPPDPQLVAQVDNAMGAVGEIADRYRATIAFSSSLAGFAAIERALNAARCPWFGIDLDPVATLRDRWTSDEILSRLGSLIRHVRGRDAALGADRRTKPTELGRGSVNWQDLIRALDSAGDASWITIDPIELPDRRAASLAGLSKLRQLVG